MDSRKGEPQLMFNVCFDANIAFLLFVLVVKLYHYINVTWFLTHFLLILTLEWSKISYFFTIKQVFRPLRGPWLVFDYVKVFCLYNWLVKYTNLPYKLCWNSDFGNFLMLLTFHGRCDSVGFDARLEELLEVVDERQVSLVVRHLVHQKRLLRFAHRLVAHARNRRQHRVRTRQNCSRGRKGDEF